MGDSHRALQPFRRNRLDSRAVENARRHFTEAGSESHVPIVLGESQDRLQPSRTPAFRLRRLLAKVLLLVGLGAVAAVPAHANTLPTGLPTILGALGAGETLTASESGIADADGLTGATFAWQWVSNDGTNDSDISGATAETYTLTSAEVGKAIKVRVAFTDDGGNEETLVSAATAAVLPGTSEQQIADDTEPPTVTVTSDATAPVSGEFDITVTFSEPTTGFQMSDLDVTNGSAIRILSAFDGTVHTVTIAPDEGVTGTITVSVPAGAAIDGADNANTASGAFGIGVRAVLTAAFVSVPPEHDGQTAFWLELSFDAAVVQGSKTHIRALLGVTGGSETRIRRKDGRLDHWRIRIQPSSHETVTVTLSPSPACRATGAVCTQDGRALSEAISATVPGPASQTRQVSIAAANPIARSVMPASNSVTEGAAAVFTLTRTGPLAGVLTVNVSVTETGAMLNGTAPATATFDDNSSTAELRVDTEDDEVDESASIVTAALSAGNGYSTDSDAASATVTVEDDDATPVVTTAPDFFFVPENGVTIATLQATDEDTAVADLSWSVTGGADQDKVTLSAGGVLAFNSAKDFEAPDDADGDGAYEITVRVNDGDNTADKALTIFLTDVDEVAPELSGASVDGTALTLSFVELLDGSSVPVSTAFTVKVDGTSRGVSSVSIDGRKATLTLASAVTIWDMVVTVGYTVPTGANANPLQDPGGNPVAAFANLTALNRTPLPMALAGAAVTGPNLTLRFSRVLDGSSVPAPAAFAVAVNGTARAVSAVSIDAQQVTKDATLTLASAVMGGDTVTVGYTVPTGANASPLQDLGGDLVIAFADRVVTNETALAAVNAEPTGLPTALGIARVQYMLRGSYSEVRDADGIDYDTLAWQWIVNDGTSDADIEGATADRYTLTSAEVGKTIKVRLTFTDDGGTEETLVSEPTMAVLSRDAPYARVSGTPGVGESLIVILQGRIFAEADQRANQWISSDGTNDSDIPGATESRYTPTADDVGKAIKVRVTSTSDDDTETTFVSEATAAIKPAVTLSIEDVPASHDGLTQFEITLRFSNYVYVGGVRERLQFPGSNPPNWTVVAHDAERTSTGDTAKDFTVRITPQHPDDIRFLVVTWANRCYAGHDICTEDEQVFRDPTSVTIPGPSLAVTTPSLITVPENTTAIATLTARADDTPASDLVWSLVDGIDADKVTLSSGGALAFNAAKDFEAPDDANYDGDYVFNVRVGDGDDTDDKVLTVRLANIDEDAVAPDFLSATVDGSALALNFHEPLDGSAVPASSAFAVKVNGTARSVSGVSVDGHRVRMTLAAAVGAGDTATVGYTAPTGANASPLQDLSGNPVAAFADQSVANDTAVPTLLGAPDVDSNTYAHSSKVRLFFSEELDPGSVQSSAFTAKVVGSPTRIFVWAIRGRMVDLTLHWSVRDSEVVTVAYTVPTGANARPLQDLGGNPVASFADRTARHVFNTSLRLTSAEVVGSTLTLAFGFPPDRSSVPAASAFFVSVNGAARDVSGVSFGESQGEVNLTLVSPVTYGDTVTVGYVMPSGANANPIQASGFRAASFAGVAVTNRTVSSLTPQSASVIGDRLTLEFSSTGSQQLDTDSLPEPAAFAAGVNGVARDVSGVSFGASQGEVVLTLASPVAYGNTVRVGYTVPTRADANRLQDDSGLAVASFGGRAVTNDTGPNNVATGVPIISGTAQVGEMLTASASDIADADGLTNTTFAWQWIASDGTTETDIAGATVSSYTLTAAEIGKTIKARVTFTDDGGANEALVSEATAAVAAAIPVVSIAAASSTTTEGRAARLTLKRTGAVASALEVSVTVTQAGAVLSGSPASTVIFAVGNAEARLRLATDDDDVAETDGRLTVSVVAGSGYGVDANASTATVDVYDNDETVSTASETLWISTLTVESIGGALLGTVGGGNALSPDGWSEDGEAFEAEQLYYFAQYSELAFTLSVAPSETGQLTLHLDDLQMPLRGSPGVRYFYWVVDHPGWQAGQAVAVKLTRTDPDAVVAAVPGVSVADAQVQEAEGAVLSFSVSLDEAQGSAVSVRYATSDGTATAGAGADYVASSGVLRFEPGETEKTISVPVLNDAHDEGSETLTLTLSRPFGAELADGTATGTIVNTDPIPKAWITRFGRTVGSQVVDAVTARFEDGGRSHVTVGGMGLAGSGPYPVERSDWNEWDTGMEAWGGAREMTESELLLGSSFHLTSSERADAGPAFAAWGRVASDGFEADVDDVKVDGDVTTAFIGFDAEWDRMLAGLLLSQSRGEGSYTLHGGLGNDRGTVESALTGVYPYARLEMSERVSMWGLAGIGSGELTLRQEGRTRIDTDLAMRMGAVGVKSTVLDGSGPNRVGLNVKSDAMWVRTESDSAEGLESAEGDVTRVRLILEGERVFETGDGATFTPTGQVGLRHDGGDAETGTGVELGAGIRYSAGALTIEGAVRALVAHEESGYEEWGVSGAIRVNPGPSGRGLSLTLAPVWGNAANGAERLWSAHDATTFSASEHVEAEGRLEATVGYGMPVLGGRFTGTPELGLGVSESGRDWRLGWRLGLAGSGRGAFGLGVEATRREPANDDTPENRVGLTATMHW